MLNLRTMYRLRRLINVMLPVLATQLAIIGMNFFDATMSGHAGAEQLAGSSIGGSLMMPIIASSTGILMAATPIIAHLIGKNEKDGIATVIHSGLILSIIIELILLLAYFFFIDDILAILTLSFNHWFKWWLIDFPTSFFNRYCSRHCCFHENLSISITYQCLFKLLFHLW